MLSGQHEADTRSAEIVARRLPFPEYLLLVCIHRWKLEAIVIALIAGPVILSGNYQQIEVLMFAVILALLTNIPIMVWGLQDAFFVPASSAGPVLIKRTSFLLNPLVLVRSADGEPLWADFLVEVKDAERNRLAERLLLTGRGKLTFRDLEDVAGDAAQNCLVGGVSQYVAEDLLQQSAVKKNLEAELQGRERLLAPYGGTILVRGLLFLRAADDLLRARDFVELESRLRDFRDELVTGVIKDLSGLEDFFRRAVDALGLRQVLPAKEIDRIQVAFLVDVSGELPMNPQRRVERLRQIVVNRIKRLKEPPEIPTGRSSNNHSSSSWPGFAAVKELVTIMGSILSIVFYALFFYFLVFRDSNPWRVPPSPDPIVLAARPTSSSTPTPGSTKGLAVVQTPSWSPILTPTRTPVPSIAAATVRRAPPQPPLISPENAGALVSVQTLVPGDLTASEGIRKVASLAFSPDGNVLVAGSGKGTVTTWRLQGGVWRAEGVLEGHRAMVESLAFAPDGRWLATGSNDWVVKLWEGPDWTDRGTLDTKGKIVAFSSRDSLLAVGAADGGIEVWSLAGSPRQVVRRFRGPKTAALTLASSPGNGLLASGHQEGAVIIWDIGGGQPRTLRKEGPAVRSLAFSPAGGRLAAGSGDGAVSVWDLARPPEDPIIWRAGQAVWGVTFSPDGGLLATGGLDRSISLWDTNKLRDVDRRRVGFLEGTEKTCDAGNSGALPPDRHCGAVNAVAFSPDGRWLASGSTDGTVRLWGVRQP